LGPWPKDSHLTWHAPNAAHKPGEIGDTWDAWGHYHVMLGLLLWHEETGDAPALHCATRIADLFCQKFQSSRLVDIGWTEMNLAPVHSLCLLYERTGNAEHLRLARRILDEFAAKDSDGKALAGDYLNAALEGKEFYQMTKPRWESLHPIMSLAEFYVITGDEKYRNAFEEIWWSIVKLDRHNNGGFSSGEQAQGSPYHRGPIETCCTIAWMALSVEMLRLTRNPVVADELELSTLNSVVGLHSPNGRWVTYNTPMDGVRRSSIQDIGSQGPDGGPELNCCACNGSRGFGMISDWALMASDDDVILNWYGPGAMSAPLRGGELTLSQETQYPRDNQVRLKVSLNRPTQFALRLRIPYWSRETRVELNGKAAAKAEPGRYLTLDRLWRSNDQIDIAFDFSLQYWVGEREYENKVSIYRGPILLTYDRRFNTLDPDNIPTLDAKTLSARIVSFDQWFPPLLLMEFTTADGRPLRLCDFGSAGVGGSPYRSWLDVASCAQTEFSQNNPRRSNPIV
jgi:DUF1680 family protein